MTTPALLTDTLTDIIALTSVPLVVDSRDTPDIIFPYMQAPLSTLAGLGSIAYVRFNPNSWNRRRHPQTNETLYNVDLPTWGTTPSMEYAMIGSKSHIDTSLKTVLLVYPAAGVTSYTWSGMVWTNTNVFYQPEGRQVRFVTYVDYPSRILDIRYDTELFF